MSVYFPHNIILMDIFLSVLKSWYSSSLWVLNAIPEWNIYSGYIFENASSSVEENKNKGLQNIIKTLKLKLLSFK